MSVERKLNVKGEYEIMCMEGSFSIWRQTTHSIKLLGLWVEDWTGSYRTRSRTRRSDFEVTIVLRCVPVRSNNTHDFPKDPLQFWMLTGCHYFVWMYNKAILMGQLTIKRHCTLQMDSFSLSYFRTNLKPLQIAAAYTNDIYIIFYIIHEYFIR
jgi:hypothetical protein